MIAKLRTPDTTDTGLSCLESKIKYKCSHVVAFRLSTNRRRQLPPPPLTCRQGSHTAQKSHCVISQEPFCGVRTHFYHDASSYDMFRDRRVVEYTDDQPQQTKPQWVGSSAVGVGVGHLIDLECFFHCCVFVCVLRGNSGNC